MVSIFKVVTAHLKKKAASKTKQECLEEALRDPERITYFIDSKWISLEDPDVVKALIKACTESRKAAITALNRGWLTTSEPDVQEMLLKHSQVNPSFSADAIDAGFITQESLDSVLEKKFNTEIGNFAHKHSPRLKELQFLRSLAKKNGGFVASTPRFKHLFSGRTSLSVGDIDKMIDKLNRHGESYEFSHTGWGKSYAQNSFKEDQLVIQVSRLPQSLQSEIDKNQELRKFITDVRYGFRAEGHPSVYGWARVHVKDADTWVIDEIQSDLWMAYRKIKANPDQHGYDTPAIYSFLKRHFSDIRDVIISAVRERAHKAGVHNIEHINVEAKVQGNRLRTRERPYKPEEQEESVKVLNNRGKVVTKLKKKVTLGRDIPIPQHYIDTYLTDLEKDGFERDENTNRFKINSSLDRRAEQGRLDLGIPLGLSMKQRDDIIDILHTDPYKLLPYVRRNNIDVSSLSYMSLVFNKITRKSEKRDFLKAGLIRKEDIIRDLDLFYWVQDEWVSPKDPEVKKALADIKKRSMPEIRSAINQGWITKKDLKPSILQEIPKRPEDATEYVIEKFISPDDPDFEKVLLTVIKDKPDYALIWVEYNILSHELPEVRKVLLDMAQRSSGRLHRVVTFLQRGFIMIDDPGVKDALFKVLQMVPDYGELFISKNWLTRDEVDLVLKGKKDER